MRGRALGEFVQSPHYCFLAGLIPAVHSLAFVSVSRLMARSIAANPVSNSARTDVPISDSGLFNIRCM